MFDRNMQEHEYFSDKEFSGIDFSKEQFTIAEYENSINAFFLKLNFMKLCLSIVSLLIVIL